MLQFSSPSFLLFDEILLNEGILTETGVANLRVISKLIHCSLLEYDFAYQTIEFPVEQAVIIVSTGNRSVLCQQGKMGVDVICKIKMKNEEQEREWYDTCLHDTTQIDEQQLDYWRTYLLAARSSPFNIQPELSKVG